MTEPAPDVQEQMERMLRALEFEHINQYRIICMRSSGSKARAYARVWNLPSIWQKALEIRAYYIIEVLSEHFDKLGQEQKEKVLIHELLHIPKTFSGALVPHLCFGRRIDKARVDALYKKYKEYKDKEKEEGI
ncbi:MAG: putative metallopeptidase [Candidatus Micrarchaeota archaeon]